jgi:hypothetical protein
VTTTVDRRADDDRAPPRTASHSTLDVPVDPNAGTRAVWLRRAFLTALVIVVILGLAGWFGVRARTVGAGSRDGSVRLQVRYAQIARAGLAVPLAITVVRPGGFDDDIVLSISSTYLDLFDVNGISPEPDAATASAKSTVWRFAPPRGSTFQVSIDAEVQGGRHWGRRARVAVVDNGRQVAAVTFKTWLSP